jgi:hypothetical protein
VRSEAVQKRNTQREEADAVFRVKIERVILDDC